MTFDPTKPVQTRDGSEAEILATDMGGKYPIAIRVKHGDVWKVGSRTEEGLFYYDGMVRPADLINIPENHVAYLNMYRHGGGGVHRTRMQADNRAAEHRIACVRVKFEEGQFDD
jgi:hypothetical protein